MEERGLQKLQKVLATDISLRPQLIQQLEKDLGHSFLGPDDDLHTIFSGLCSTLEKNPEEWRQWLYRADVDEKKIARLSNGNFTLEEVAILLLEREMQKVIFRKQYGS